MSQSSLAARTEAVYRYDDERGAVLYEVVRLKDPKEFRQRIPLGNGLYEWHLNGVRRVPYHLPEVLAAIAGGNTVIIVEGEKDADALVKLGLCATTNAGGANWPWSREFVEHFRGASEVIVIPDCDEVGRKAAAEHASLLEGVCEVVRFLDLAPERSDHYDFSDWITEHEVEEFLPLCAQARLVKRVDGTHDFACARPSQNGHQGPQFIRASDLAAQPQQEIEWIVDGMIPYGGTALLVSKPKVGKSTTALTLALQVARGEDFLGRKTRKGPVLYAGLEGSERELHKRLAAMGVSDEDDLFVFVGRAPDDALAWIREAVEQHKPVVIIIDTLQRFARLKDLNDYAAVSNATDPLIELARESGAALVYLHHAGKSERTDVGDTVLGSTAIFGSVDTTLFIKRSAAYRTLCTQQRYGDDLDEIVLKMDPTTFLVSAGGTKHDADITDAQQVILDYLVGREAVPESSIRDAVEVRRMVFVEALRLLVSKGQVLRQGGGKKNDPYRYALPAENSGSVVPDMYGEQWEPESEIGPEADNHAVYSGSRDSANCNEMWEPESDSREPECEGDEAPIQADGELEDLVAYAERKLPKSADQPSSSKAGTGLARFGKPSSRSRVCCRCHKSDLSYVIRDENGAVREVCLDCLASNDKEFSCLYCGSASRPHEEGRNLRCASCFRVVSS
jgi:hypothetical protein